MVHSIIKNPNENMLYCLYMAPSSNYLIIMHTSYYMQLIQINISQIMQKTKFTTTIVFTTNRDCRRNKVIIKRINQSKLISQSCWSDWVWQLVGMNILWLLGAI